MATAGGADRLPTLLQLRSRTDVRIETKWILPAAVSYLLWIFFGVSYFTGFSFPSISFDETLGLLGSAGFITSTGLSFLIYNLISRQNRHVEREQEIAIEIISRIQSRSGISTANTAIPLSSAEQDVSSFVQKSREQSAILWSLLVLSPYAGWVFLALALFILTQSANSHERMEGILFEDIDRTLVAGGPQHASLSRRFAHSRNSAAYLAASIVTLGFFALSWLYIMIIGEEAHFSYHSNLESELVGILNTSGTVFGRPG